jgi:hypothetical protein
MRDPQGLRRPRFSFFIFTCQTARDQEVPTFQRGRVPTPLPTMDELQSTYVDCCVTQQGEEHQWRVRSPWSVTRRRRAQWSGYRPHPSGLSTTIVRKSSHGGLFEKSSRLQHVRSHRAAGSGQRGEKTQKKFGPEGAPEAAWRRLERGLERPPLEGPGAQPFPETFPY